MTAVLRALSSPRAWQATFHVVAGMFLGATTGAVIWGAGVLWWAAVLSLVEGPTGYWMLPVLYVAVAVLGPLAVPPCVQFFSALQRERFRVLHGVEIAAPKHDSGTGWRRAFRPWTTGSTWRQFAYHLLAPVLGGLGGVVVVLCWAAPLLVLLWADGVTGPWNFLWFGGAAVLLLAAPWVARGIASADTAAARRLLGRDHADELAERVESLARSRADLVAAADTERRRIERDLHDGVQQRLVSLALNLGMARAAFTDQPPEVLEVIAAAHDEATVALAELRDFVRGLHPAVLDDRGLDAALSGVVARAPLPVRLHVDVARRCSPSIEAIAYFAVSEALTNVAKHAQASRAEVVAERVGDRLIVTVTDDGRGGASVDSTGTGLRGLAQRAAAVDGSLTVVSPLGGPTTVTVYVPCE
ncbi:sensor histidine kinase [Lentzea tibetensis]|uniref:histidine kinase n=1 Tax=Lentzea tibetensis TaxID=2591470 RepID=A0A563EX46_9PSEU|nr:sensor histidine kinase [Lentzea tibetensis]TWP52051.1 sensor histidine kinase [Lentzea tibetensis]